MLKFYAFISLALMSFSAIADEEPSFWEKLKNGASNIWTDTQEGVSGITEKAGDTAGAVWDKTKEVGTDVTDAATTGWEKTKDVSTEATEAAKSGWDKTKDVGSDVTDSAKSGWDSVKEKTESLLD